MFVDIYIIPRVAFVVIRRSVSHVSGETAQFFPSEFLRFSDRGCRLVDLLIDEPQDFLARHRELLCPRDGVPESCVTLGSEFGDRCALNLRLEHVDEMEQVERAHDPSDHLRAVLLTLKGVEMIFEL